MATREEQKDIQQLKTDVALIKQEQKNQTTTLDKMNSKLDNLAFVSQKDFDTTIHGEGGVMDRLKELEKIVYAGGVKASNFIFGSATKIILTAVSLFLIFGVVIFVILTQPAVQSALERVQ